MEKYARFNYQPCLPLGKDGRRVTASKEHMALTREAAGEGMVLLKNINNDFDLCLNPSMSKKEYEQILQYLKIILIITILFFLNKDVFQAALF